MSENFEAAQPETKQSDSKLLGETRFDVAQIMLDLERYPAPEINLQAWNAADTYLLDWLADKREPGHGPCCVVNDSFGALALGLVGSGESAVSSWSDSFVAHQGAKANAVRNNIAVDAVRWVPSTEVPQIPEPFAAFALVVVKVPKSLDRLQQQLEALSPFIDTETMVVAGGMTKQIHTSTINCFERTVGPTTTSLARKKARLIFATPETPGDTTPPKQSPRTLQTVTGLTLLTDPALFSYQKVDPATALLLDAITPLVDASDITDTVDMGCGSGVVGMSLLQHKPGLAITFTDESYMAVAMSKASLQHNIDNGLITSLLGEHTFLVDDCGSTIGDNSVDLVVINPPFHDATAQTMAIAKRMFVNAARVLRPGRSVVVVGNRHLNHHTTLRRWFTKPTVIASDRRFVVLHAEVKPT